MTRAWLYQRFENIVTVAGVLATVLAILACVLLIIGSPTDYQASVPVTMAPNPTTNLQMGSVPDICFNYATAPSCERTMISYLDEARRTMGLAPYALPAGFLSFAQAKQVLVLTNLDRAAYGLPPVRGLSRELDAEAQVGAEKDEDPPIASSLPHGGQVVAWGADWEGGYGQGGSEGYRNVLSAYYDWMYSDGLGSRNEDCTYQGSPGCWGHRKVILMPLDVDAAQSAMGFAEGVDNKYGGEQYALIITCSTNAPSLYYRYSANS